MTERCGFVAVVGAPNSGKSTLVNALVGQKVAIVTPKAQTTRTRLLGIALHGDAQDADLIALVVDSARGLTGGVAAMLERLAGRPEPKLLVLNKIDLVKKDALLALAAEINARAAFEHTFMISAATGDGVADLKQALAARIPAGPWHFPADQVSDVTDRMLAAEITREQLYHQLHAELPYDSAIETERYEERADGSIAIHQQILVARDSQKAIVLGKSGARIRAIGEAARKELSLLLGRKVHLFLHVKVNPQWGEDRSLYRDIGLEWVE